MVLLATPRGPTRAVQVYEISRFRDFRNSLPDFSKRTGDFSAGDCCTDFVVLQCFLDFR